MEVDLLILGVVCLGVAVGWLLYREAIVGGRPDITSAVGWLRALGGFGFPAVVGAFGTWLLFRAFTAN